MLFRRESINEDVTPGAPAMLSFSSHCMLSGAQDNGHLSGTPSWKHLPRTWVVLLALPRLAACSPTLALPRESPTWAWGGRYSQDAHGTLLPWEAKGSVQGWLKDWSWDFSKAGQDYPRKITLFVCSSYFPIGTGLAHPLLTKFAFPAAALEPCIWLTLAKHPGTNIDT